MNLKITCFTHVLKYKRLDARGIGVTVSIQKNSNNEKIKQTSNVWMPMYSRIDIQKNKK